MRRTLTKAEAKQRRREFCKLPPLPANPKAPYSEPAPLVALGNRIRVEYEGEVYVIVVEYITHTVNEYGKVTLGKVYGMVNGKMKEFIRQKMVCTKG